MGYKSKKYDDEELYLIYCKKLGYNSKDQLIVEFIFSDQPSYAYVEDWFDENIGDEDPLPPNKEYISKTIDVNFYDIEFNFLYEFERFRYIDGYLGILPLMWEEVGVDEILNSESDEIILVFNYGESFKSVKEKLNSRDFVV